MEMTIYSPKEGQEIIPIEFNFEEIQNELQVKLKHYNEATYDDESIKTAKADRAILNRFKETIETKRKEIKKQCLAPYEAFEVKVKLLVKMLDEPILQIDGQVKAFEERKRQEKLEQIEQYYIEQIGELKELVSYESIANLKWKNIGYTLQDAFKDIEAWITTIKKDIASIKALGSQDEQNILAIYFSRGYNLGGALQENECIKAVKKATESVSLKQVELSPNAEEQRPANVVASGIQREESPQGVCFRCYLTSDQKAKLRQFMIDNNIKYSKI